MDIWMMNNDNYIFKELDIRNYKFIRQGRYNLADKNLVRNINNRLKKNYKILSSHSKEYFEK